MATTPSGWWWWWRAAIVVALAGGAAHSFYRKDEHIPKNLTAAVGGHLVLDCEVEFPQRYPIPYRVYWTKGDEVFYAWSGGREEVAKEYEGRLSLAEGAGGGGGLGRAALNLSAVRASDAGWYRCQPWFPHRQPPTRDNGTWFHVSVAGGNLLAIPPVNRTVREGDEALLRCQSKDAVVRLRWLKDGLPLEDFADLSRRARVLPEGGLVVHPTTMGDAGWYACEASDGEGSSQVARAFLDVQYPAKVVYAPPEVRLPIGRSAVLDCHYRSNPPLTSLRWEKDGFLFDPFNVPGVFFRRNGSLYFASVDDTHAGKYTCTPHNDLGTAGPSPPMYVLVQRPPVFIRAPQAAYAARPGDTAEIPCEVSDGDGGPPQVAWEKKGGMLPAGRHRVGAGGNLSISDVRFEDAGAYRCSASNGAAAVAAETELVVAGAPTVAPHSVTAAAGANAVRVAWKAAPRANAVFSVWLRRVGTNEWRSHDVGDGSATEATVTGLDRDTEYEMMVVCRDDGPQRLFSKSIKVRTLPYPDYELGDGPIEYPRNVTVSPEPDGSILVKWLPPSGAPPTTSYVVRWSKAPDDTVFEEAYTIETAYLIRGLEEGKEYDVQVVAVAPNGQQAVSAPVRALHPGVKSFRAVAAGVGRTTDRRPGAAAKL